METLPQTDLFPCSRCLRRLPRTLEFFGSNGHGGLWQYCRTCQLPGTSTASTHKRRQEAGLCIVCGKPRESDRLRCDACTATYNEQRKARRDKWVGEGRCQTCGSADVVPGKQKCQRCVDVNSGCRRAARLDRLSRGLCPMCGERPPAEGQKQCDICANAKLEEHHALRDEIIAAYGGICACCGETNRYFLTIDHVNNDGTADRAKKGSLLRRIKKLGFPPDYQLLCYNCNCTKGFFGACPHTWAKGERPNRRARLALKARVERQQ